MPKRLIDYDALWASEKLEKCPEWARLEYLWMYGLADANGVFEMTNLKVLWAKVSPIRPELSLEVFIDALSIFRMVGLLFCWVEKGKKYGYWTGADKDSRLPSPSERHRYKNCGAQVPRNELVSYESGQYPDKLPMLSGLGLHWGLQLGLHWGTQSGAQSGQHPEVIPTTESQHQNPTPKAPEREEQTSEHFQVFWEAYPNKLGEREARRIWMQAGLNSHTLAIMEGVDAWKESGWWDDERYVPRADKFLGERRWQEKPTRRTPTNGHGSKNGKLTGRELTEANLSAADEARAIRNKQHQS